MNDKIDLLKVVECQETRLKECEKRDNERTADHAVLLEKTNREEKRLYKLEEDIQHLTGTIIALQRDKENMESRLTNHNNKNQKDLDGVKQDVKSLKQDFKNLEHEIRKHLDLKNAELLKKIELISEKIELISEDINKSKGFFGAVKPIAWAIVGIILTGTMGYFGGKFVTAIDGEKVERSK
jgi:chromosome segregation ATPase